MYEVPDVTLIPQQLDMACWYASARMLIKWKSDQRGQSLANLIPPELDARSKQLRDANNGITNPRIITMAKRLGLRAVPPMTPSLTAVEQWLRGYGPLWVNGRRHIVVIAGIDGRRVKVYDPWPPGVGKIEWRDFVGWYEGMDQTYTVKPGDNLSKIAARYNMGWSDLYRHPLNADFRNKRPNPNLIHPGDVIQIPAQTGNSTRDTSDSVRTVFLHCP